MTKSDFLPLGLSRPEGEWREVYEGRSTLLSECPMVGWSRFDRASAHLGAHIHTNSYEICYLVRGSVEWWAGSQIFQVGPRDIYITRPGETHGGVDAFMHPCELYWVQVRPSNSLFKELSTLTLRHFHGGAILGQHFERILAECRLVEYSDRITPTQRTQAAAGARAALQLLVLDTLRFHAPALEQSTQTASPSAPILAAMRWIHAHFHEADCLEQAARVANLRGTQFRKRFLAETGFAPHDYLMRAQVQEAKRLLSQTYEPITSIAFDLGFSSSQYFATAFRKLVGLTPQTYRQHHSTSKESTQ